jgi:malate synthase
VTQVQAMLDTPPTVDVNDKPVSAVSSGLIGAERLLLQSRGFLNPQGRITPLVFA